MMTQKEYHKQINKRFYEYINNHYPEYKIDSSEGYGRVYLIPETRDDMIEYHQSYHTLCQLNWASDKSKQNMLEMEKYINENIIPVVNLISE